MTNGSGTFLQGLLFIESDVRREIQLAKLNGKGELGLALTPGGGNEVFRCGLAHEFYVKQDCTIHTLPGSETDGIGVDSSGKFCFVVETYLNALLQGLRSVPIQRIRCRAYFLWKNRTGP